MKDGGGKLQGKVALVSGASRGIGRGIALALAREGADVAICYRHNDIAAREVHTVIEGEGRRCVAIQGDVSRAEDVARVVQGVRRELGGIEILVNNAGIAQARTLEDVDERLWDETMAVNLKGAFLMTQAVLADMRAAGWGRIINISSVAAHVGGVVGAHYAASKAGLIGFTHYLCAYLAKDGITANAIAPGPVATDMAAALPLLRPDALPVGRFGTVEEIAEVAVLLAANGFITGETININGGRYLA